MPPRQDRTWPHALLAACGGFLLATLWFDLMFDIQVLAAGPPAPLPESVVASIAAYYRRVTTEAHPMQQLIGVVMAMTVIGTVWMLARPSHRTLRWAALLTSALPIGLAAARVLPNAVRLGTQAGSLAERSALARSIFADHVFCLVSITVFTAIHVVLATNRTASRPSA
jgi:hypothetical protein